MLTEMVTNNNISYFLIIGYRFFKKNKNINSPIKQRIC
jgi:hypothetical protein